MKDYVQAVGQGELLERYRIHILSGWRRPKAGARLKRRVVAELYLVRAHTATWLMGSGHIYPTLIDQWKLPGKYGRMPGIGYAESGGPLSSQLPCPMMESTYIFETKGIS